MDQIFVIVGVVIVLLLILGYFSYSRCARRSGCIYNDYVYFDNNGTTPIHKTALDAYSNCSYYGNASSSSAAKAREVIASTSDAVRGVVGPCEVVFTSGGSESNNMVIRGAVDAYWLKLLSQPRVVISSIEHKTSIECVKQLEKLGRIEAVFIQPNIHGEIDPSEVLRQVNNKTCIVSIMHINNETGTINNIEAIGNGLMVLSMGFGSKVLFHVDAVQSFGKYKIPAETCGIDAISASMHKLYGPTGVGVLALSTTAVNTLKHCPQICGSQNNGLRGGTENIPGIAAAGEAIRTTWRGRNRKNHRLLEMKKYILSELTKTFKFASYESYAGRSDEYIRNEESRGCELVVVSPENSACNTLLLSVVKYGPMKNHFCNIELKKDLFDAGVIISIGSVCNTSSSEPSHVLTAISAPFIIRCGIIRISLGDYNTKVDCDKFVDAFKKCVKKQLVWN